uniref:Uncharacterized protein n=1 Tax=Anopheles atroparvus TaxID=41427 RepID=A0AAG5DAC4_ANOAO
MWERRRRPFRSTSACRSPALSSAFVFDLVRPSLRLFPSPVADEKRRCACVRVAPMHKQTAQLRSGSRLWKMPPIPNLLNVCVCVCVCLHISSFTNTHTHQQ